MDAISCIIAYTYGKRRKKLLHENFYFLVKDYLGSMIHIDNQLLSMLEIQCIDYANLSNYRPSALHDYLVSFNCVKMRKMNNSGT